MPERNTQNEDLFHRGSSANLPRLHTCENKVSFWDFSQFAVTELKNLLNMKLTLTSIVTGALGTVTKGLLKGLKDLEKRGRMETI